MVDIAKKRIMKLAQLQLSQTHPLKPSYSIQVPTSSCKLDCGLNQLHTTEAYKLCLSYTVKPTMDTIGNQHSVSYRLYSKLSLT